MPVEQARAVRMPWQNRTKIAGLQQLCEGGSQGISTICTGRDSERPGSLPGAANKDNSDPSQEALISFPHELEAVVTAVGPAMPGAFR